MIWEVLRTLTFNVFYHCTSLQLKKSIVLNNREWCICEKIKIFNGQPTGAHKHVMCREWNVAGLKLPEDGVNKHQNVQQQETICEGRKYVVHDSW